MSEPASTGDFVWTGGDPPPNDHALNACLAQEKELNEVNDRRMELVAMVEQLKVENQALQAELDPRDTLGLYDGDNLP